MADFKNLTIRRAVEMLQKGEVTAEGLAVWCLEEIKKRDSDIHAYLEVFSDVLDQAKEADRRMKAGEKGPLLGIPIAVKDNILIKGRRAGSASKILENYVASYDSTVAEKLKKAGAVLVGRTNMDEFAMGSSTENSAYGPSRNPIDLSRVPGGSSGGSAASVAGGLSLGALGSDTGGSIRQPASFCGLVGFKPTYGAVSRHGLMAMGSSLDVIGPITKTAEDAETIFNVLRGKDSFDSTSIDVGQIKHGKEKLKVADITDFIEEVGEGGADKDVMADYAKAIDRLKSIGYEVFKPKTDLSVLRYSLATYYVIMPAEVSTNLARFDGIKYGFSFDSGKDLISDYKKTRALGFGKEVRRRILLGTYVLSAGYYDAYYGKAMEVRELLGRTLKELWSEVDLMVMPTTPTPAFKFGENTDDPLKMYLADVFTVTANMVGAPAISVPSGFVEREAVGLPLGLQIMAPVGEDELIFKVAKDFLGEK